MKNIYGNRSIFFRSSRDKEFDRLYNLALEEDKKEKEKEISNTIITINSFIEKTSHPVPYDNYVHGKSDVIYWSVFQASDKLISFLEENKFPFGYGLPPKTTKPKDDEF